jgi:hypothetical protein
MHRILVAAVFLSVSASSATASEIPAFARKYGVSCATCHMPVPRLNAVGEAFAANGFEFTPGELRDTIQTGDPILQLQRNFPLAVRYDAYLSSLSKRNNGQVIVDQQFPWVVKLLSGGQVAKNISYYAYFLLAERGEVAGLEDAYLQFTDIGGTGISAIVGQFQVSDPLFKRELRLEYEDYQPYRVKVGLSPVDLTYDRGIMALWSPWAGSDVALQIVNGQGLRLANEARQMDADGFKNLALRVSQDAVGPLRLGAFGYLGDERDGGVTNRVRVWGPDATLGLGSKGELNLQFLRRWDDDPFFGSCSPGSPCPGGLTTNPSTRVDAGFAEAVFWPGGPAGRWYFSALGNYVEADRPVVSLRLGEQLTPESFLKRYVSAGFGVHYLLRRNVRLLGEGSWDFEQEQARLVTGFSTAF